MLKNETYKRERENTFEISREDVNKIVEAMVKNRKNIIVNGQYLMVEKPKKVVELHLLASDSLEVTRDSDGTRHRLKFNMGKKKTKITYSLKHFIEGKRFEEEVDCGGDYEQAFAIFKKMPPVDAVMLKYSLKYDCTNHLNNSRVRVSIECCYAINPEDNGKISPPFFYIEIEEKEGVKLEEFRQCEFFVKEIMPFLKPLRYPSHNRVLACQEYFPRATLIARQSADIYNYVRGIYENITANEECFDYFSYCQSSYVKGEKLTERGDSTETEIKFIPGQSHEEVLSLIRPLLSPEWTLVKVPPRVVLDIYMDTEDLYLYNRNSHFRFRKRKKKTGWVACFKQPIGDETRYLERRTVRTMLNNNEALLFQTNNMPGLAAEVVYEFLKTHMDNSNMLSNGSILKPVVLVVQCRERYVVRPKGFTDMGFEKAFSAEEIEEEHFSLKRSDMLHIMFDDVMVFDIRDIDIQHLINYSELDFTEKSCNKTRFITAEVEPNCRKDLVECSLNVFEQLQEKISQSGFKKIFTDKYQIGVDSLKICKSDNAKNNNSNKER